jgi:hypothetical protein
VILALTFVLAQVVLDPVPVPTPSPTPVRAPTVVVERIVDAGAQTRRLTLFANRVAVVSLREGERQVLLRRLTLDEEEYIGYLLALERDATKIDQRRSAFSTTGRGGSGVITLAVSGVQRRLEYRTLDAQDISTARLITTLDDIERRVVESNPAEEELRGWEPQEGDVVELVDGQRATVDRVLDEGMVFLRVEGSPLLEAVAPEHRAQRVLRVVRRGG